ncbi:putative Cytochrome P450, family 81, subfamily D, polypeptide 5 [Hibiscus syriacus]|uniref:Cytochrome P450, family 81, subfamily D, polypeptide 5 n=1 Tax=Hibiscus syriacus TaxID=106335 RepID=A0A6A3AJU2_HIBSY|nr:putative Cytochrome P450, family 81, subfamily D, polypeptide 5 [Hibiscus syriacus]
MLYGISPLDILQTTFSSAGHQVNHLNTQKSPTQSVGYSDSGPPPSPQRTPPSNPLFPLTKTRSHLFPQVRIPFPCRRLLALRRPTMFHQERHRFSQPPSLRHGQLRRLQPHHSRFGTVRRPLAQPHETIHHRDLLVDSSEHVSRHSKRQNQSFAARLYRVSTDGFAKVELKSMFSELTFNIITRMIAGKQYFGDDVAQNSEEGRRFREMIKELFELSVSSYPGDFLPILQWVDYNEYIRRINWTLRLFPAAQLLVPHSASEICSIGGYEIPKDAILMVNAWAIQRDPKLWDDLISFKPERFEQGKETSDLIYKLMPFGLGRRACPGMVLARHVLGSTLGHLFNVLSGRG